MVDALVKNAADPAQVAEAGRKERRSQQRDWNDVRVVMSTKEGRRFVFKILSMCRMNKLSFNPDNPNWTAFNEGARNVGLAIQAEVIQAAPKAWSEMISENNPAPAVDPPKRKEDEDE
jgi:hypothetical protein